jgi:hypothetical protein
MLNSTKSTKLVSKSKKPNIIIKKSPDQSLKKDLVKKNKFYTKKVLYFDSIKGEDKKLNKILNRYKNKLSQTINLMDELLNPSNPRNDKIADKLLKLLKKYDTNKNDNQVGGGNTRMDSIKNSLKTYKRRYDNAKTQESKDRLNKLYNKILLNKTRLNIKYYKNKINELNNKL